MASLSSALSGESTYSSSGEAMLPFMLLPPQEAYALTVRAFILMATVGVFLWDTIHAAPADYELSKTRKITTPWIAYVNSRIWTLVTLIYSIIYTTAQVGNCKVHDVIISITTSLGIASCTMLVLLRIRAAFYYDSKLVGFSYLFFWVAHTALMAVGYFATPKQAAENIRRSKFCIPSGVNYYQTGAMIFLLVYHGVVFGGVFFRIGTHSEETSPSYPNRQLPGLRRLQSNVLGKDLQPFSRRMLRSIQVYHLVTMILTIVGITLSAVYRHSPYYGSLFTLPTLAIMNIMACRVYRSTKLDGGVWNSPPRMTFALNPALSSRDRFEKSFLPD